MITKELTRRVKAVAKRQSKLVGKEITTGEMMEKAITRYVNKKREDFEFHDWKMKNFSKIYKRDAGICLFCHSKVTPEEGTLDHLTPTARGGKTKSMSNVALCCLKCNQDKGLLTAEEYIHYLFMPVDNSQTTPY